MSEAKSGFEVMEMRSQVRSACAKCCNRGPGCRRRFRCRIHIQMGLPVDDGHDSGE